MFLGNTLCSHWITWNIWKLCVCPFPTREKIFSRVACKNVKFVSALSSLGTTYDVNQYLEESRKNFIYAIYRTPKLIWHVQPDCGIDIANRKRSLIYACHHNARETLRFMSAIPITCTPCAMLTCLNLNSKNLSLQGWDENAAEVEWMKTLATSS